ncbi:hypothetical protein NKH91_17880 [Mesorhizobium sp. M0894]|uniref:hypothetical protein n=1 Tax=unclassified Mesorhizobium TaxID=325217 RepID=UPI003336DB08
MAFVKGQRYIDRMAKGWTLQSLIDGKMRLIAFCHNPKCHHNQALDLEARPSSALTRRRCRMISFQS